MATLPGRCPAQGRLARPSLLHPDACQCPDAPLACYSAGGLVPSPRSPCSVGPLISLPTPAQSELYTIDAISPTLVPSVLHAVAPRRVACGFRGGVVTRSLYSQKSKLWDINKKKLGAVTEGPQAPGAVFGIVGWRCVDAVTTGVGGGCERGSAGCRLLLRGCGCPGRPSPAPLPAPGPGSAGALPWSK